MESNQHVGKIVLNWECSMKKKLIAGNWKMNGSLAANAGLVSALVAGFAQVRLWHGAVCAGAVFGAGAVVDGWKPN